MMSSIRHLQPKQQRPRKARGYTMIELVMAIGIFSIGVTGVAAMQASTTTANRHAKNLAIASGIARNWQEQLAIDATLWRSTDPGQPDNLNNTVWIKQIAGSDGVWLFPTAGNGTGPSFDALGNYTANQDNVVFCAHIRLTRLIRTSTSGLVRSEVRVFWPKQGHAWDQGVAYCTEEATTLLRPYARSASDVTGTELDNFHLVYTTTAIRQTPAN